MNDIMLATEVASKKPKTPAQWDEIAVELSTCFTTENKVVNMTGRGCRDRLNRLINKYVEEDKKALKR